MIPFECNNCKRNYCIKHRLEQDHECSELIPQSNQTKSNLNSKRLDFFQRPMTNSQGFLSKNSTKNEHDLICI